MSKIVLLLITCALVISCANNSPQQPLDQQNRDTGAKIAEEQVPAKDAPEAKSAEEKTEEVAADVKNVATDAKDNVVDNAQTAPTGLVQDEPVIIEEASEEVKPEEATPNTEVKEEITNTETPETKETSETQEVDPDFKNFPEEDSEKPIEESTPKSEEKVTDETGEDPMGEATSEEKVTDETNEDFPEGEVFEEKTPEDNVDEEIFEKDSASPTPKPEEKDKTSEPAEEDIFSEDFEGDANFEDEFSDF